MCNDSIKISNQIMDLIWRFNRSSNSISCDELEHIKSLWDEMTLANRDYFRAWARIQGFKMPRSLERVRNV